MTFTVALGWWMLPLGISSALLAWAFLMPLPKASGDYNFAPVLSMMLRLVVVTIGTLFAWLIWALLR